MSLELNQRAAAVAAQVVSQADVLRVGISDRPGVTLLDFGVREAGGLQAGLQLARLCLADLAEVDLVPAADDKLPVPQILVRTDHPLEACLGSQYAGWKIATDDFFAMGSGPLRIHAAVEELQRELGLTESRTHAVGILEAAQQPTESAIAMIRDKVGTVDQLVLATAPTASLAGTVQVVARSVETALHKLHDLNFPVAQILSGSGVSPLPPVAANDLQGIGRTNDAILYGAVVNLWVECEDELLLETGPQVPSCSSPSHGSTFGELFAAAGHDFYKLDPQLFSPAMVVFHNLKTGHTFQFGRRMPNLLRHSFGLSDNP